MKTKESKGVFAMLQEQEVNRVGPGSYKDLTLKEITDAFRDLFYNRQPSPPMKMQMVASDFAFMSDEEFKAFVTSPDVTFIGGSVAVNKMLARCRRLGIIPD